MRAAGGGPIRMVPPRYATSSTSAARSSSSFSRSAWAGAAGRSQRCDWQVVEVQLGLPVVEREERVGGAVERLRIVEGEEGITVDAPLDVAVLAGDGPVVPVALVHLHVGAGEAVVAVL